MAPPAYTAVVEGTPAAINAVDTVVAAALAPAPVAPAAIAPAPPVAAAKSTVPVTIAIGFIASPSLIFWLGSEYIAALTVNQTAPVS